MKPQIKYTESGDEELNRYLKEQAQLLEKYLLQEKYVIGDESIEITGSDIIRIKQKLNISYKNPKRSITLKFASYIYGVLGVIMTAFGFLYSYFNELLENNPEQALIIITGLLVLFLGIFLGIYVTFREKKQYKKAYTDETNEYEITIK